MSVSLIGLVLAVPGFILLGSVARPFWGLTQGGLIVTMVLFVVAIGWSVAQALPVVHYYLRAPSGQHWNANGQPILEYDCCNITSAAFTLGQKITNWAQVVAAPLLVFISGLRAGYAVRGFGWMSAGAVMTAVGLSIIQSLGSIPLPSSEFGTISILPAGVFVIVGGAIVVLVGVGSALWTLASRASANSTEATSSVRWADGP
jgi:hypothetical protein